MFRNSICDPGQALSLITQNQPRWAGRKAGVVAAHRPRTWRLTGWTASVGICKQRQGTLVRLQKPGGYCSTDT